MIPWTRLPMTGQTTRGRSARPRERIAPLGAPILTVVAGPAREQWTAVDREQLVIGRGADADFRIADDELSRAHAKLLRVDPRVVNLLDLDSKNGTFVNGARIDAVVLRSGDQIQLGPETILHFVHTPVAVTDASGVAADPLVRARILEQLTPRELEVARLVVEGLGNQRVAKRLSISVRTVESHLDRIYDKLDVSSRQALLRSFYAAGLVTASSP